MKTDRPWTPGPLLVSVVPAVQEFPQAYTLMDNRGNIVAFLRSANAEADARLFASALAMYEALKSHETWEAHLILSEAINHLPTALMEELLEVQKKRNAALRAANPAAFESEGE